MKQQQIIFDTNKKSLKIRNLLITNALLLNHENKRKELIESSPSIIKISLQTLNLKKFNYHYL